MRAEDRTVLLGIVEDLAVVRQRHAVLAVGEHVTGARIFLQPQAVHRMLVRKLDDLVALHDVETHPRHAAVGLVVHEGVAAVIGAVGERDVRVMQVAVHVGAAAILEEFAGLRQHPFGQHLQALVGLPPSGGAATVEDGNAHQFAHRGQADDAHLAGLAAREEDVVFVEFARAPLRSSAPPAAPAAPSAPRPWSAHRRSRRSHRRPSSRTAPPARPTPAAAAVVPSSVRRLTPFPFSLSLMIASSAFGFRLQVE